MRTGDGIDMLIGTNFTRSMNGGIRIEGDEVTLYKKVTRLKTNQTTEVNTAAIEELDMDEEFYQELQETVSFSKQDSKKLKARFKPILNELREQGYIGEEPLKHWRKNGETCRLDIINPDVTIQDKPLKHVTPALEASFQKHVDALLKLGVIRPSKSRHITMTMMVNSGTTVDPATGKEIKGKERMVFNYRTLNDNTYKDQYSLPGINTLIQRIGTSKLYSKFDLKSGFHQVAMAEDSIEWTTFLVPKGLYEWLVMPFGLKNAPAIFKRKMDECFKGTEEFIAVYIDDILVFSKNEADHEKHLQVMHQICQEKDQAQEVLMKSLNMIEEVLEEGVQSKKERNGLDQIIQISNHCQEYMKGHSHSRNQEHYTEDTKSKPIHSQSQMKQEVPTLKSHNNWNPKQQENQLQPCEISKQFWTSKPKSVFQNQPVITSGETTGQRSESKIKGPESCFANLRPYATNWVGSQSKTRKMFSAQSKFLEGDALNDKIARRQQLHKRSLKWNQVLYLIDENWTPPITQDRYAKL
ncbi:hypothetical protein L1987_19210 [Smallanthus sonchifolius]|uniref:Uncharacterized protein n=1 Tax=Smallanthus sonchifolius TaxID=185202 RepID=A0ACB9INU6_9ASTR|nr:hypothetical protein L1987_19210 [Smallanthus sonchifolius]